MSSLHWKYILVGGGLASSAAAQAIRQIDPDGSILLIGQEINRPYHRPPLSNTYLTARQGREGLFTLPVGWFAEHHVDLRTGCQATRLDLPRRTVVLSTGDEVGYAKLLIATGAAPAHLDIPGATLPNVYYLRSIEDADRLRNALDKARHEGVAHERSHAAPGEHPQAGPGLCPLPAVPACPVPSKPRGRAVVVGAGLLGTELAAVLTQLGLSVDLLSNRPYPWHRQLGETAGRLLARYLQGRGVRFHPETAPVRFEGDGRVQRVVLGDDRKLDCDLVVGAVGIVPNKQLVRGAAIHAERAILIDRHARTSHSDVYAAGDCAAIFDPRFDKYRRLDHWESARIMGEIAGRNMAQSASRPAGESIPEPPAASPLGRPADAHFLAAYDQVNHFSSQVFDLTISAWGEGRLVERRIVRGNPNPEAPDLIEFGVAADARIAQIVAIQTTPSAPNTILGDLVARRLSVNAKDALLRDPAIPLSALLDEPK